MIKQNKNNIQHKCKNTDGVKCPAKSELVNKKFGYPERGWIQLLILKNIYDAPLYGYDLMKNLKTASTRTSKIKSGSMYTTLRRMEEQGLLKSKWDESDIGPARRTYFPTRKGKDYLKNWLRIINDRIGIVNDLIKFYKDSFHE
ncbi:MAG: Transcriptional regulator, PadR-like protein family [candidate division WWE3 bacterium GW2011_GWF2_41_45]|uniref:Transcription regulator PadR N-terminal domain-containing protein n=3 Tax=Katanobacteria TaxID=422282 RepID=A0A1F4W515_UNCKA|nr:MAG: Transcriptional regulator, PadR-like protein family [candidate division WWE3 bacterium GW2011_GWC2_41_23]KKS10000.1 MAG: Transcriptional regulator, PadR-like protein family [candidate division WWE3 bacterium GW2011_GWF2_41_45]KKS11960.1 MAG: Transcriptional regulator, PadR-like protein family [candidate division WWE3 bacterium GW2011_GWF1_41_53]KKS19850.1 MAG: Transcriptional regulator, PadR-like protein family [candidate division WWE3 bacterium GW2011_GWE1_41_72]KKS28031.1 MAG: transcr